MQLNVRRLEPLLIRAGCAALVACSHANALAEPGRGKISYLLELQ
jgi:hypothetical protein